MINDLAFLMPSSNILRTSRSPGPISHSSTQASTPLSSNLVPKFLTKRSLSSVAWQTKTLGLTSSPKTAFFLWEGQSPHHITASTCDGQPQLLEPIIVSKNVIPLLYYLPLH